MNIYGKLIDIITCTCVHTCRCQFVWTTITYRVGGEKEEILYVVHVHNSLVRHAVVHQ